MKVYDLDRHEYTYIDGHFKTDSGLNITICANYTMYWFFINDDIKGQEKYSSKDITDNNFKKAYEMVKEKYGNLIEVSDKEKLLEYIEQTQEPDNRRNRMGCSESWYEPYFAMKQTFSKEQIEGMSALEINNLLMLASNISDGLY